MSGQRRAQHESSGRGGVAVIILVSEGAELVRTCLRSVAAHTREPLRRIIVVNDSGGDPEIGALLEEELASMSAELIENPTSLGYAKSINLGIAHANEDDVVLLDADTEVGPRWLTNLRAAAYARSRVGTVTAFSTNAGVFAAPVMDRDNPLPAGVSFVRAARAVSQNALRSRPRVPAGSGCCMYIRRPCIDETGVFDEQGFPVGDAEGNDFCTRAAKRGWRHVVDDATYVRSARSGSLGDRRASRARSVAEREARRMKRDRALRAARRQVGQALERAARIEAAGLPRIVFALCVWQGGTPKTNEDLMRALSERYACYVLFSDGRRMTLYEYVDGEYRAVASHRFLKKLRPFPHAGGPQDALVRRWLVEHSIECLHIRHIGLQTINLPRIAKEIGIPVVKSFHDFYVACPTVRLVDDQGVFCGGRCTESKGPCKPALWSPRSIPGLKHERIGEWRKLMTPMLESCDRFVTTSEGTRSLLQELLPVTAQRPFEVIPHGRDFPRHLMLGRAPKAGERVRVLVPGNISKTKGAEQIKAMAELDEGRRVEFHVIGRAARILRRTPGIVLHGEYRREELMERASRIQPHFGAVLSICPETFCHALTEMWMCGLPVAGYDLGAVGERIREHGGGWLLNVAPAEVTLEDLRRISSDSESFSERLREVDAYQCGALERGTTAAMAERYERIYRDLGVTAD